MSLVALALSCSAPPVDVASVEPGWLGREGGDFLTEIIAGPLTTEGVRGVPLIAQPQTGSFLGYLVRCALPQGDVLVVDAGETEERYSGSYGLAPEWLEGPCDVDCQEKVSSCLLASTNLFGLNVYILTLGPHVPASVVEAEAAYAGLAPTVEEAAFYGNYFTIPQQAYACTGTGVDPFQRAFRVCSHPTSPCGIQVVGPCGNVDGSTGLPSETRACETFSEADRHYLRCHDRLSDGDGGFGDSRPWAYPMTTRIWRSDQTPGEDTCFD